MTKFIQDTNSSQTQQFYYIITFKATRFDCIQSSTGILENRSNVSTFIVHSGIPKAYSRWYSQYKSTRVRVTKGKQKIWQWEAMVSLRYEYCEIVMRSQWKNRIFGHGFEGLLRKNCGILSEGRQDQVRNSASSRWSSASEKRAVTNFGFLYSNSGVVLSIVMSHYVNMLIYANILEKVPSQLVFRPTHFIYTK